MKRIYKVEIALNRGDSHKYNATHLVRAASQSQASAYVMKDAVTVSIPSQDELWALGQAGCQVEDA